MDSPFAYLGGKSKLAATIINRMPEHQAYCELFAGAAWVFFRKEPSKYETINDLDGDLISFYRVLQNHLEEFLKQFKWLLSSREWFQDWKTQLNSTGLTDIQRAARFFYLQRHAFAGRPSNPSFGGGSLRRPRINLLRLEEELSEVHLRLSNVTIEHLSWSDCLKRYDTAHTFFFVDPPYWNCRDYKFNLETQDFIEMAGLLKEILGRFILSLNDRPETQEIFKDFNIKPVTVRYTANAVKNTVGKELLITNF